MLPTFCLRLACGLIGPLLILSPGQINPRFYRVQFLTVLALSAVAALFLHDLPAAPGQGLWIALFGGILCAFLGSLAWSVAGAPAGRFLVALTAIALVMALGMSKPDSASGENAGWLLADDYSSAALLGTGLTAMLMGHSYLIAPAMSLTPLLRLLGTFFTAIVARSIISGAALWFWTTEHSLSNLEVTALLPVRWGVGLIGALVLGIMAWQSARIRSTQSATGILYVAVVFCFLGELMGQLLFRMTHFTL